MVRGNQNQLTVVEHLCAMEGGDQKVIYRCQEGKVMLRAIREHGNILYVDKTASTCNWIKCAQVTR